MASKVHRPRKMESTYCTAKAKTLPPSKCAYIGWLNRTAPGVERISQMQTSMIGKAAGRMMEDGDVRPRTKVKVQKEITKAEIGFATRRTEAEDMMIK